MKKCIIFHKEKILLSNQTIFWSEELSTILDGKISRKINFDSIDFIELTGYEESSAFSLKPNQWIAAKEALHIIDANEFGMLARAISLLQWDRQHQFCGECAQQTVLTAQAFERYCPDCNIRYYPRISPAVIILIYHDDKLLMARSKHFPPGAYGLIAGFVEAGETLEDTVHREILEEVGIKIKNLAYYGSQPWPFPDSLMIGFMAEYESGELLVEKNELEDAGWYRYDNLPGIPSFSMSISTKMIKYFQMQMTSKANLASK